MTRMAKITAVFFGALLLACLAAAWLTRDSAPLRAPAPFSVVDRKLLDAARLATAVAETPPELELARQAIRLADHELDQAFATAVREAADSKPARGGALEQLTAKIADAAKRVADRQERIAALQKSAEASDAIASQLELARAQLALDEDELEDARLDVARQGGDERSRLEQAAREHADAQKEPALAARPAPLSTGTLGEQVLAWWTLSRRREQVAAAMQKAADRKTSVEWEHKMLEDMLAQKPAPTVDTAADAAPEVERDAMLARLHGLSDQRKTLMELDRRIQDCGQIVATYQQWTGLLDLRRRSVIHSLLWSLAWVLGILLVAVIVEAAVRRAFHDPKDRRRAHQQRFLAKLAVRGAAVVVILLLVFGTPNQTPTIIGLATAGLTVALKDFLVAFLGWFVLMGRNGVRVGDWVEIKGVGGEVIEVGLFKTMLLEMGNWTNTGHPTGRRVSFMNGYAIESAYFNFSTAGQWLWDELQVTVPKGGDPYAIAEQIRAAVEKETEDDAQLAEQDWGRITRQYGTQQFSARPAVDLRPVSGGLEVQVRYITRGPQRYEVKSRLFRQIVDVMRDAGKT
ncbi:MAG: mechanosensitive ion channel domain-containing protein [Candidatus Solibacter sp.]